MNVAVQGAFRALADPTRRQILMHLSNADMTIAEVSGPAVGQVVAIDTGDDQVLEIHRARHLRQTRRFGRIGRSIAPPRYEHKAPERACGARMEAPWRDNARQAPLAR